MENAAGFVNKLWDCDVCCGSVRKTEGTRAGGEEQLVSIRLRKTKRREPKPAARKQSRLSI
jgi:hypothetical protein